MIKNKVIFKILILTMVFQFCVCINPVEASSSFWDNLFGVGDNFLQEGKNAADDPITVINSNTVVPEMKDEDVKEIVDDIYNILFTLGVATTVIVGAALGIKFMMASAEDKAKIKESMVPYVAGCVVIYGAFGIWKIAIEIFSAIG